MFCNLYRYTLPLLHSASKRSGILLHLTDDDGREGWGEMAPYPGRSQESLEEAEEDLKNGLRAYTDGAPYSFRYASAAFCLESALAFQLPLSPIPLCPLLFGAKEEILERAHAVRECSHVKIKVSTLSEKDLHEIVYALAPTFTIRLDANCAFSSEEAKNRFADLPIEYVEEPTYERAAWETLPFPFALDESLLTLDLLPQTKKLTALVIKPTIIGRRRVCSQWATKRRIVLSSCFETGVGIAGIVQLGQHLSNLCLPAGLDTYRLLKYDILQEPFRIEKGWLVPPKHFAVHLNLLESIFYE